MVQCFRMTDDEEKEEQLMYFAKAFSTLGQKKKKSFLATVKRHLSGKDEVVEFNKYQQGNSG